MTDVTQLLQAANRGDRRAAAELLPLVYDELRKLAAAKMAGEKPGQTLDATGLVHEAYLRLLGGQRFDNRGHFFAAAAQAIRRILIDNARGKGRLKRGGRSRESLSLDVLPAEMPRDELLDLHDALERLANHDAEKARIVEMRFFGGMSFPEIAEHYGVSLSTIERGWRYARAWLYADMSGEKNPAAE